VTFLCLVYVAILCVDIVIVIHGFYQWCKRKSWSRYLGCCCGIGCCHRTSIVGTVLLWITLVLLLGQISFGLLCAIAFFGLQNICDAAVDRVKDVNLTESFSDFYQTSGLQTMIQFVSDKPLNLKIAQDVEASAKGATATADSFISALEKFCDQFGDDIVRATLLICVGAFIATIAQVTMLVYQSKYYMIWWYEEEIHKHKKNDDAEERKVEVNKLSKDQYEIEMVPAPLTTGVEKGDSKAALRRNSVGDRDTLPGAYP